MIVCVCRRVSDREIARHAHAGSVMVSLHQTDDEVVLEITDDGKGFDAKDIKNKKAPA